MKNKKKSVNTKQITEKVMSLSLSDSATEEEQKEAVLMALDKYDYQLHKALLSLKISNRTFYGWINADPEFKLEWELTRDYITDLAETGLIQKIKDGDLKAIIYALDTQGKKRGYVKRREITDPLQAVDLKAKELATERLRGLNNEDIDRIKELREKLGAGDKRPGADRTNSGRKTA